MAEQTSYIQAELVDGEKLLSVVENLRFDIKYVPHISPVDNWAPKKYLTGTLALTNYRIIVVMWDGIVWKWLHISGLNWYSERFLSKQKPNWPYQAVLMIPSGMALLVETEKPDKDSQRELYSLLKKAFTIFGTKEEDTGAILSIIDDEEKKKATVIASSDQKE